MMEPRPEHYLREPGASATPPAQTGSWASAYEELKKIMKKSVCRENQSRATATNGLFKKLEKKIVHSANLENVSYKD